MSRASPGPKGDPLPVLPIAAVLSSDLKQAELALAELASDWAGIDIEGEATPFANTDYYEQEMGGGLSRRFVSFCRLDGPDVLVALKQRAWEIDQRFAENGQRTVNLDPGYIDATKVVLASFKPGTQKIYLGHGVWADLVAYFQHGAFGPLPWTFPDMRDGPHLRFFEKARQQYKAVVKRG